ncbi:elongation factor P 5-aminopentanone reductase [Liquorilactobacillus capillatus]|uniref:3-oxoacyl-[acyl-carrier protein] reductase n=1 Tax=Liquorilactobacillus capillatus DSM 19910 TaxID=1423731 RepID=A0A0R1M4M3_9LACO|nr:SDR family NAD(P)-dependent oxidoreductase [Liquorilactobacillus capillatus]KRL03023.1 3-oxoacyl-[acyl-carrier protein] reductase [Liquorilactobacillus capillatus DSM 19910]
MKWALIVGSSGDIGSAIVRDLASQGWSIYLHYFKNKKKSDRLCKKLQRLYPKQDFLQLQGDLTQPETLDGMIGQLFSLDAVVFAQGTTCYGLFHDLKPTELNTMLTMQLTAPLYLLQKLEDKLAQNHFGRIVFIGSVYGGAGSAMEVGYSTVKGALSSFVAAYSKEISSLGITINVVAPGAVETQMNTLFSEEDKRQVNELIPVGRFAAANEISYWVQTILGERASYLTGETIYVTGGWLK